MTRARATAVGLSTLLLWATLATLTIRTAPVPPFLLTAVTFAIGGAVGLGWAAWRGRLAPLAQVPLAAYAFATLGLFGNHAFYFAAFRWGPAADVMLVCYLWPLLIVLGSACLPGERLRARHLAGACLAFGGVATLLSGPAGGGTAWPGVGLGLGCALTWAVYSVGSRALGAVPPEAVAVSCLATAALSVPAHLLVEETAWPATQAGWAALALIGVGPVGVAFLTWDVGCKRGNIQLLGVASYAAPLLSTALLILAGEVRATPALALAAALVTAGSLVAAGAGLGREPSVPPQAAPRVLAREQRPAPRSVASG